MSKKSDAKRKREIELVKELVAKGAITQKQADDVLAQVAGGAPMVIDLSHPFSGLVYVPSNYNPVKWTPMKSFDMGSQGELVFKPGASSPRHRRGRERA